MNRRPEFQLRKHKFLEKSFTVPKGIMKPGEDPSSPEKWMRECDALCLVEK